MNIIVPLIIIIILFIGVFLFRNPRSAKLANSIAAFSMLLAVIYIFMNNTFEKEYLIIFSIITGTLLGYIAAIMVDMTMVPAMVAFQHGMGGIAAFIVAYIELVSSIENIHSYEYSAGVISIIIGAATFSGSIVASLKLSGKIKQTPTLLKNHNLLLLANLIISIIIGIAAIYLPLSIFFVGILFLILTSTLLGILFSIRIGGADMPVLISFLNATAGLAASFCGIILGNSLLIVFGATVAASGSVLTYVMCKAMNRNLLNIFISHNIKIGHQSSPPTLERINHSRNSEDNLEEKVVEILKNAKNIVIIPGYGMALSHAQFEVKQLADILTEMGKDVNFAIHPVAGRMPGHMNVLLAEADVPYDKLFEMDAINDAFPNVDATIIVGACDVVNPAAVETEGTPISGMPILKAHESKNILIFNFDDRPGYSGVENPLYRNDKCLKVFGDAKTSLQKILKHLNI